MGGAGSGKKREPARGPPSRACLALLELGWIELNARLLEIHDEALLAEALHHERRRITGRRRPQYVRRLYARFSVLRRRRELAKIDARNQVPRG